MAASVPALDRRPVAVRFASAWALAALLGVAASWFISRSRETAESPESPESPGQISDAESLQDGPTTIYPDQAVAGYPDSESGSPDEGPAGPNSRPDWRGPGTGA